MKNEFSPSDIFVKSIRLWWVVVIFTIIGGVLGVVIHGFLPPIFSSRIIITTSINFAKTGVLTDEKQDQTINAARDVILSDAVEEAVLSQAVENGIEIDSTSFEGSRFSDRIGFNIIIGVDSRDPKIAASLTNIWGEIALSNLNEDLLHSLKAEVYSTALDNLEACFEEISLTAPSSAVCQSMTIAEIQDSIDQTSALLAHEIIDSHAVNPSMAFALNSKAMIPTSPTYRNRNLMVLSGVLIGFITGILVAQIPRVNKNLQQK